MNNYQDLQILKKSKSVCLITHLDPDTDALASLVLMKHFLAQTFDLNHVDIFSENSGLPENYLPIIEGETLNPQPKNYDTAIMLDAPNVDRLGIFKNLFLDASTKIVIDHHATNSLCGEVNCVEDVSSTSQLLYKILNEFNYNFSNQDYGLIYAGIITDTNNFSVGNIDSETFLIASICEPHINRNLIYDNFFSNNTYKNMQILALAINHLTEYQDGKLQISYISLDNVEKLKIEQQDYLGVVNKLSAIANNKITAFIYPRNDEFYVSLRAKQGFDVSQIAKEHNGGGHVGASGYLTKQSIDEIKTELAMSLSKQIENTKITKKKIF